MSDDKEVLMKLSAQSFTAGYVAGAKDALRLAVEAVKAAKSVDVASGRLMDQPADFVWLADAVKAIEDLGQR